MERKIKLIWDFKGPGAEKTAIHHAIHLKEYVALEKLEISNIGSEILQEFHSIAFMIVSDSQMRQLRDILKPHRGELAN